MTSMTVEDMKKIWGDYKNTSPKTKEYKNKILEIVKQNPSTAWPFVFEADPSMAHQMYLLEIEHDATKAKKDYLDSQKNKAVLKMITQQTYTVCKKVNGVNQGMNEEYLNIWKKVFSDIPEFMPQLKETFSINKAMYENMLMEYGIKF